MHGILITDRKEYIPIRILDRSKLRLALDELGVLEHDPLGVLLHALQQLGTRRDVLDEAEDARRTPDAGVGVSVLVDGLAASARDKLSERGGLARLQSVQCLLS